MNKSYVNEITYRSGIPEDLLGMISRFSFEDRLETANTGY